MGGCFSKCRKKDLSKSEFDLNRDIVIEPKESNGSAVKENEVIERPQMSLKLADRTSIENENCELELKELKNGKSNGEMTKESLLLRKREGKIDF